MELVWARSSLFVVLALYIGDGPSEISLFPHPAMDFCLLDLLLTSTMGVTPGAPDNTTSPLKFQNKPSGWCKSLLLTNYICQAF